MGSASSRVVGGGGGGGGGGVERGVLNQGGALTRDY